MIKLVEDRSVNGKELRKVFVDTVNDLMDENKDVVILEADLGGASGSTATLKKHPDNFIQCGISEANMVGVACGMSTLGYVPFIHTFAPFATRRVYDQVYLSGAYAKNTINIYGSDPGFTVGANGGTHTSFEDIALMRAMPEAIVCDAADETQFEFILREFSKLKGVHYVRAGRKACRQLYDKSSQFELGKGVVVKEGKDVLIVSCGQIVSDALDAAEMLEKEGISVEVIDMFTIKPLDKDLLVKEAAGKKAILTFENHSIINGLGSAVSEVIAEENINTHFKRVGVTDRFGQVGSPSFLQKEFGLTAQDLYKAVKETL